MARENYELIIERDGIIKGVHAGRDFGETEMGIIDELIYGTENVNNEEEES